MERLDRADSAPVPSIHYILQLWPFGAVANDGKCHVSLGITLYRWALLAEGHTDRVTAYFSASVSTSRKPEMQAQLRESVSEIVTDLANEILKARGQ